MWSNVLNHYTTCSHQCDVMLTHEQLFSHHCWGVSESLKPTQHSVRRGVLLPAGCRLRASYFVKSTDTVCMPWPSPRVSWVIFHPLTPCKQKCHDLTFDLSASAASILNLVPLFPLSYAPPPLSPKWVEISPKYVMISNIVTVSRTTCQASRGNNLMLTA